MAARRSETPPLVARQDPLASGPDHSGGAGIASLKAEDGRRYARPRDASKVITKRRISSIPIEGFGPPGPQTSSKRYGPIRTEWCLPDTPAKFEPSPPPRVRPLVSRASRAVGSLTVELDPVSTLTLLVLSTPGRGSRTRSMKSRPRSTIRGIQGSLPATKAPGSKIWMDFASGSMRTT